MRPYAEHASVRRLPVRPDTYHYARRYQLVSFFGRVNYTFKDRYLLTATVRRDGTSRFAKENRWGTYPAVAVGWKASSTKTSWKAPAAWMNDLKLRFDYGVTGQQDLGTNDDFFPYLPTYYTSPATTTLTPSTANMCRSHIPESTTPTSSGKRPPLTTWVLTSDSSTTASTVSSTISARPKTFW